MGDPNQTRFNYLLLILFSGISISQSQGNEILGCGGFVKSHVSLDVSNIEIGLYTKEGSLVEKTECAPTNGYYFLPLYEKGDYILKVQPPAGWSFEPSQVELLVDGESDQCSTGQDINFSFNGFGITGKVITAGQTVGPNGISVQLVDEKGNVRDTVTSHGGDFHFTPVIPGKYDLKASHSKWKVDPALATVQVKEGNTVLPIGVLAVKGYDVTGSVTSFGSPISGVYVLLYSKEENPKFRVEGCKTALLQGVPDSPICYSISDAAGEFNFGLVPAGDYKLVALAKSPGQAAVTFNIKPDNVLFSVKHDSQYIKNAFEVTGFTVVGTALASKGGKPMSGARVLLAGQAVATTDALGKFTLSALKPGNYILSLKHEQCEWEDSEVRVSASGAGAPAAAAARWRVCGRVAPPRPVGLASAAHNAATVRVDADSDGNWCTFLAPGTYTARVEVTEQEHRDGMQFFPEFQQVVVESSPVSDISFSQLRATVTGRVVCDECPGLSVALRNLAADGSYMGEPMYTDVQADGSYSFPHVSPGSAELSVRGGAALCWREAAHNVAVAAEHAAVPDLVATGHLLRLLTSHAMQIEYSGPHGTGTLSAPAGPSAQCVGRAGRYQLVPASCRRVRPASATVVLSPGHDAPTVEFRAISHATTIRVTSEAAGDVTLRLEGLAAGDASATPQRLADEAAHVYEHTLYLAEGEEVTITPISPILLFRPAQARVRGTGRCEVGASFRATRGVTVAGKLVPPVEGVTVTLTADDLTLTQVTKADGAYSFGPLEGGRRYAVAAQKPSYEFGEPDRDGHIAAHKLADIDVMLVDEADDSPLEGALVSVSGGTYRRTAASGAGGLLRFGALSPAQYYVKANMKEYRFAPPHHTVDVLPAPHPQPPTLVFRGSRVAWSASGRVVSLGGAGRALGVRARPVPASAPAPAHALPCAPLDATASDTGYFRIRGLLPSCRYALELKDSPAQQGAGARLLRVPPLIEVKGKDVEGIELIVHQPAAVTDATVLIHASPAHYRTLRLSLAPEAGAAVHSAKLDAAVAAGNPGVLYALPRLPADNRTYVLTVESSLARAAYAYHEPALYFNADGGVKHFDVRFEAKVRASEQELRASPLALLALLAALALAAAQRRGLLAALRPAPRAAPRPAARPAPTRPHKKKP